MKLQVAGIVRESIVDGPGIRLALYVQGCPHRCPGCHNPQTWDPAGGTAMALSDLQKLILGANGIDGVTFSGGEPFAQPGPLLSLALTARSRGLNVVLYSGYTFEELWEKSRCDSAVLGLLQAGWLLVDGPYLQSRRSLSLPFRGSANQRLIDLAPSLQAGRAVLWESDFPSRDCWSKIE